MRDLTPLFLLRYTVKEHGYVKIEIYNIFNILGQRVSTLVNGYKKAGNYTLRWDAKGMKSGVYFVRFKSGNHEEIRKSLLLK